MTFEEHGKALCAPYAQLAHTNVLELLNLHSALLGLDRVLIFQPIFFSAVKHAIQIDGQRKKEDEE